MADLPGDPNFDPCKSLAKSKWAHFANAAAIQVTKPTRDWQSRVSRLDQVKFVGGSLVFSPNPESVESLQKTASSHVTPFRPTDSAEVRDEIRDLKAAYITYSEETEEQPPSDILNIASTPVSPSLPPKHTVISQDLPITQENFLTSQNKQFAALWTDVALGSKKSPSSTEVDRDDFAMDPSEPQGTSSKWPKQTAEGNRPKRSTKWATAAELRGERGVGAGVDVRSNHGDMGFGDQVLRDYGLADWSGNWAPPPPQWEDRGYFVDSCIADRIAAWMENSDISEHLINIGSETQTITGEIAPRSWIHTSIDDLTPDAWYTMQMPLGIAPFEDAEPLGLPWWRNYVGTTQENLVVLQVPTANLDRADNDMGKATQQTSEYSRLTHHNTALRKTYNEKKTKAIHKLLSREIEEAGPPPNKWAPQINLYIRPAGLADLPQIYEIYNHYISTSIFCAEMQILTITQVRGRWEDIVQRNLPFFVAIDPSSKGNRDQRLHTHGSKVEAVLGFGFADDHNEMNGMYRYTVEIDMFVKASMLRKGVGRCLLDRILSVLDPCYCVRGGYDFRGDEFRYGPGGKRVVGSIIVNIPYDTKDKSRAMWMQNWLSQWEFEQAGELFDIGRKLNTSVSQVILARKTGCTIEP